jgi:transcriptional regulator with XRE-family HTH domain
VTDRRADLGEFLRARRAALRPEDVGLPAGDHRRTPGLRREELAMLAGVSVTWYTWLEQGRPINASRDVLIALARTLRLDDAARDHLLALAAPSQPPSVGSLGAAAGEPAIVPDSLVHLVDSMGPAPAYLLGPRWEFLAWNSAQALLYPPIERLDGMRRNLLWAVFADPGTRTLLVDWPTQARRILAEFRAATAAWRDDPLVVALVDQLRGRSPELAAWWAQQDVAQFQARLRAYDHPRAGRLVFEYQVLVPAEWPHLRVVCQLPVPGDDSAARLAAWHDVG